MSIPVPLARGAWSVFLMGMALAVSCEKAEGEGGWQTAPCDPDVACDQEYARKCEGQDALVCVRTGGCLSWSLVQTCSAWQPCAEGQCQSAGQEDSLPSGGDVCCEEDAVLPDDAGQPCQPECAGKACGDDGCGGLCGTCTPGLTCTDDGACVENCAPDCAGKECGGNGCGGSCGDCAPGESCGSGQCVEPCKPDCAGKECGDNGCGGKCGSCPAGWFCKSGICDDECTPQCAGKECGDDGCGGACGKCPKIAPVCNAKGLCEEPCKPICKSKECGDDGCGGSCGTCVGPQEECLDFQCECVPACSGKECGADGCGGICGECKGSSVCEDFQCVCSPDCTGKECGDDGCSGSCGECPCPGCDPTENACFQSTCTAAGDGTCLDVLACVVDQCAKSDFSQDCLVQCRTLATPPEQELAVPLLDCFSGLLGPIGAVLASGCPPDAPDFAECLQNLLEMLNDAAGCPDGEAAKACLF